MKMLCKTRDELAQRIGTVTRVQEILGQQAVVGRLQTCTVYEMLKQEGIQKAWGNVVWYKHVDPKLSFVVWQAILVRLCTQDRFRGNIENQSSPFCTTEEQSTHHLFFRCRYTVQVWGNLCEWLGIPQNILSLLAAVRWIKHRGRGNGFRATTLRLTFAAATYYIWKARNELIFERTDFGIDGTTRKIKIHVFSRLHSTTTHHMQR
ncbi:hypothetical protein Dimus_038743 [Dionaea muscipula]